MLFGQATFTNEAARDTAFANPGALAPITIQEGMRAYLTAPTVPAATGGVTAVPTGVTTVYNGSAWVCLTPLSATTNSTGTTTSATYTASLSGSPGTNPSVTLVTGTTALVSITGQMSTSTSVSFISVAVSGAGTVAASDDFSVLTASTTELTLSRSIVVTGLTAGTNTFTLQYRSGGTGTFNRRTIVVQGIA
jgi:hypothetical protein